jgi:hypothetical protein
MRTPADYFLLFLIFGLSCQADEGPLQISQSAPRSEAIKVKPSEEPIPEFCSLTREDGVWLIPYEKARQLRDAPWAFGATASLHSTGVKLDTVSEESIAACLGLRGGDVLSMVGFVSLQSAIDALPRLEALLAPNKTFTVRFWRGASLRSIKVKIL